MGFFSSFTRGITALATGGLSEVARAIPQTRNLAVAAETAFAPGLPSSVPKGRKSSAGPGETAEGRRLRESLERQEASLEEQRKRRSALTTGLVPGVTGLGILERPGLRSVLGGY